MGSTCARYRKLGFTSRPKATKDKNQLHLPIYLELGIAIDLLATASTNGWDSQSQSFLLEDLGAVNKKGYASFLHIPIESRKQMEKIVNKPPTKAFLKRRDAEIKRRIQSWRIPQIHPNKKELRHAASY
jgi:hypothetical protein